MKTHNENKMQFVAKAMRLPFSPFKLRPIVDVVRGKKVDFALGWLASYQVKKAVPVLKLVQSATANAAHLKGLVPSDLFIKEIKVDGGRISRYYKPGSMGRALPQRKRFCHISLVLETLVAAKGV